MESDYQCRNEATEKYVAGPQHYPTQTSLYHSRGGVSHQWKGPGFYLLYPLSRYTAPDEVWDPLLQGLDRNALKTKAPEFEFRYPHSHQPMNQKWPMRPFFHSVSHNKWLNEHSRTAIPRDARLFYNEEDWMKFKNMVACPTLPGLPIVPQSRPVIKPTGKRRIKCPQDHDFYF